MFTGDRRYEMLFDENRIVISDLVTVGHHDCNDFTIPDFIIIMMIKFKVNSSGTISLRKSKNLD